MSELSHCLEREVLIRATPEVVFGFFTDSARWASWWGESSGAIHEVLSAKPLEMVVFTYGYASGKPIPPGASKVTVTLRPDPAGTRLHLLHEFAESGPRDMHVQGWRFQLSVLGNLAANQQYAGAQELIDSWYEAWTLSDEAGRRALLEKIATPGISFRDRYSLLEGVEDVTAHIGAALRFMPGVTLRRTGNIRHCQGTVLADWNAGESLTGTSVFQMTPDGRIEAVTSVVTA